MFSKILVWIFFVPYTLVDFWQILSYALFGDKVVAPGGYVLTDYSIYVPIYMLVILLFYFILIEQLWKHLLHSQSATPFLEKMK